jgi:putative Ca2+/H+ antiporter (TMEM165/GDT1 family)
MDALLVSFAVVAIAEIGDKSQVATVALAAQSGRWRGWSSARPRA